MLAFEKALQLVLNSSDRRSFQKINIEKALGMCLKGEIRSPYNIPSFDRSLMDGYAFKKVEIKSKRKLKCVGTVLAGEIKKGTLKKGECLKIMTGAPLVKGADTVVPVEQTEKEGNTILVLKDVKKGANIGFKGESFKKGQKVLQAGTIIQPSHMALLASIGREKITVIQKPRVAIINTGEEIISLGKRISKGEIYNCNGPQLQALLKTEGVEAKFLGIVQDEKNALLKRVTKGLGYDILLITGGVSMGDYDLVPEILAQAGVKQIFHKVKIKPGKPLFFGKKNKTLVFGLPGNPLSTFVNYLLFVKPAIKKMMGIKQDTAFFKEGILQRQFINTEKVREYFAPAEVFKKGKDFFLLPIKSFNSGDVNSLAKANGFLRISPKERIIKKGRIVNFFSI